MLTFPNIDPVALELGPLAIRWYSLAYVAGILLGWQVIMREHKNRALEGLTRESLDYWRKKHPIDDQNLEIAYRENQRHFMTESLKEIRQLVLDLRDAKPSPGAAPKTPRP